ncbi:hypothetical protein BGY98DRAFT_1177986 [Russula aff. rugulosa BPL654]|nr:hypothetical protein BGY98DRAFT_1177986 [Russula aff. rugulosa BPL654]
MCVMQPDNPSGPTPHTALAPSYAATGTRLRLGRPSPRPQPPLQTLATKLFCACNMLGMARGTAHLAHPVNLLVSIMLPFLSHQIEEQKAVDSCGFATIPYGVHVFGNPAHLFIPKIENLSSLPAAPQPDSRHIMMNQGFPDPPILGSDTGITRKNEDCGLVDELKPFPFAHSPIVNPQRKAGRSVEYEDQCPLRRRRMGWELGCVSVTACVRVFSKLVVGGGCPTS